MFEFNKIVRSDKKTRVNSSISLRLSSFVRPFRRRFTIIGKTATKTKSNSKANKVKKMIILSEKMHLNLNKTKTK